MAARLEIPSYVAQKGSDSIDSWWKKLWLMWISLLPVFIYIVARIAMNFYKR
jgi:hypothetical protein